MALVVFTGGARSGKSTAAASLATLREADGARIHVCVFGREGVDDEFDMRIAAHRATRPASWSVTEANDPVADLPVPAEGDLLLIDCLGTAVGRIMELTFPTENAGVGSEVIDESVGSEISVRVETFVHELASRSHDIIVVTNEVGSGVVPTFPSGRLFQDVLGVANRRLIAQSDAAYLCVAGRLVDLGASSTSCRWPHD